jgi:pre-mRNA-processing factor 19
MIVKQVSIQILLIRGNFQLYSSRMFFCAISGEAPLDPVVSNKSGHVYERRLILKYISENGTDPITGEKLEESDLVSIKASKLSTTTHLSALTT